MKMQMRFLAGALLVPGALMADTKIRIMAANTTSGNQQAYEASGIRGFQALRPDIVLIQEFNYEGGTLRQLVDTAFGTEFNFYVETSGGSIPNGIVSRYPILASGAISDAVNERETAWARIDIPGPIDLWAVSMHLRTSGSEQTQGAQLAAAWVQSNVPAGDYLVMGGDFNTGSRNAGAVQALLGVVTAANTPVDQNGNDDTNNGRNSPYDWVMPDNDLNAYLTPVVIGANSFPNGLVFDSRVYNPLADVSPVQRNDSGGFQHMNVIKDFLVPDGAEPTPTASMTPSPSPTPIGTGPTPTVTPTPTGTQVAGPGGVFINEIHYDDDLADENEAVEIAGPAGTNVSGWSLVSYNGNGGGTVETVNLSGVIPDQGACIGTLSFAFAENGLQNGSPDGVALVNASNSVVQFLSWEGTFAATSGPASGMTSTDIGVEELGTTPNGFSLQLQGTGKEYVDFTWTQTPIAHTRGLRNTGQTFAGGCASTPTPSATVTPIGGLTFNGWTVE